MGRFPLGDLSGSGFGFVEEEEKEEESLQVLSGVVID